LCTGCIGSLKKITGAFISSISFEAPPQLIHESFKQVIVKEKRRPKEGPKKAQRPCTSLRPGVRVLFLLELASTVEVVDIDKCIFT
jgi:hypothetical protein